MMKNGSNIMQYKLFAVVLLICFLIIEIDFSGFESVVNAKLNEYKLLPREEHFTELYFDDPHLYLNEKGSRANINYSFTIHNMISADKEYYYIVYFFPDTGSARILDHNTIFIKNNEKKTIQGSYFLVDNYKGKISVKLPELKQEIHLIIKNNK